MSTPASKRDRTLPDSAPLEEIAQPEQALTPEQTEQLHGGSTVKGALTDVCKTPTPGGPIPIPYPN